MTTTSTRTDQPVAALAILEGWARTVAALRELAADVDPRRLHSTERRAIVALVFHLPESVAHARFIAWAETEQELASLDDGDHSPATSVRRGELMRDAGDLLGQLVNGHPYAPAWPLGQDVAPDPVRAADLIAELRAQVADRDARLARMRARAADLEAANLSLSELLDVMRPAPVALTEAGMAETGGATVLELPLAGAHR